LSLLAGGLGGCGYNDGSGSEVRFCQPTGVAVDASGNLYIADGPNDVIRKVTPAGVVTTLAGAVGQGGSADGQGAAARFDNPVGVALNQSGELFVADANNSTLRKVSPSGLVSTLAGRARFPGFADGTGAAAGFNHPRGVAVDASGDVIVGDTENQTIRVVTPAGVVTTLAGAAGTRGQADGTGSAANFSFPAGVAVDISGNVFVADSFNHTIRKVTAGGVTTTLAGLAGVPGGADGTGTGATFSYPEGVALDGAGQLYVADSSANLVRTVSPAGVVTTLAGTYASAGSTDGTGAAARFETPWGIAVTAAGTVLLTDFSANNIRAITPGGVVSTFAGNAGKPGFADGVGAAARFDRPEGVGFDSAGDAFVADTQNQVIRQIAPDGTVSTLAGNPGVAGQSDGTGTGAQFRSPSGLAVDAAGDVFVADRYSHTLRKVTPGGVVTTFAGTAGATGTTDGPGSSALFNEPRGLALDGAGNLYVADTQNSAVRKVTPGGVVSTVATSVSFGFDFALAVDGAGTVYLAESAANTIVRITPGGVITTLAGSSIPGTEDGQGATAHFDHPAGIALDTAGDLIVSDGFSNTLRQVTLAGLVTTIAGRPGIAAVVPGFLPAALNSPGALAAGPGNTIVVAESLENALVTVTPPF
jgi:hypothetical protein